MIKTIEQLKTYLTEKYGKYNIVYQEDDKKEIIFLKGKKIKLPISKENLNAEYEVLYKIKRKKKQ